jgi:hypothetical protein
MTRALDANQTNALSASHISGISFVELDFSTPLYLCSLPYNFSWNGITWIGAGSLGSISPVGENGDLQAQGVQLSLTGVDSSLVSTALSEAYQGKGCQVWFCPLDPAAGQLIGAPIRVFVGRIDTMAIEVGDKATITLTGESRLIDFLRPRISRYTDAEQQALYPGDLGLQYVNDLQEANVPWGVQA